MSRAAVTYKTKEELQAMGAQEAKAYLEFLNQRLEFLRGPARKEIEKRIEVAKKILHSLSS